jgi:hypothetical protein
MVPDLGYDFPGLPPLQQYLTDLNMILQRTFTMIMQDLSPDFGGDNYVWRDGSKELTANWDVGAFSITVEDITVDTPVNIYALSHDSFADFAANEHIDWTNASDNLVTTGGATAAYLVVSGSFTPPGSIEKVLSGATNDMAYALDVVSKTDADMVDGFGSGIQFKVTDTGVTGAVLGKIGARRSGADTEGEMVFYCGTTGGDLNARLTPTGDLEIAGDLQVDGNDIGDSGGSPVFTFDGSQNTTIHGNVYLDGGTGCRVRLGDEGIVQWAGWAATHILASNLYYDGSGNPITNLRYLTGAEKGAAIFLKANTPDIHFYTCQTASTGIDDLATLQEEMRIANQLVTMQYNLVVDGDLSVDKDTDNVSWIGRAAIGYNGTDADRACFAHMDKMNASDYALAQDWGVGGDTYINAPTGSEITFRINDQEEMQLDGTDLRYRSGSDRVAYFGYAAVGYNGTDASAACFGQSGAISGTSYALMQDSNGTHLNAAGGDLIYFRVNDVLHASMGSAAYNLAVDSTTQDHTAAYFTRNTTSGSPTASVVRILQDHTSGFAACLELDQDDASEGFIDFVGSDRGVISSSSSSARSVRVEWNGTVYRIALYADA